MSTKGGGGNLPSGEKERASAGGTRQKPPEKTSGLQVASTPSTLSYAQKLKAKDPSKQGAQTEPRVETSQGHSGGARHVSASSDTSQTAPPTSSKSEKSRQVIAVSASKGPAAFFNLARKFLVTDEMCDLSALEGAIVSAVDAAHLLERSKLATIVRVETSYVSVEPKRKKQHHGEGEQLNLVEEATTSGPGGSNRTPGPDSAAYLPTSSYSNASSCPEPEQSQPQQRGRGSSGRELRRARIVITVQRTEGYKQWLEENPLQAIIAGDSEDYIEESDADAPNKSSPSESRKLPPTTPR